MDESGLKSQVNLPRYNILFIATKVDLATFALSSFVGYSHDACFFP